MRGKATTAAISIAALLLAPPALAATIVGTAGADQLQGTTGDDLIRARAGNDRVAALAGDDVVRGGAGNDLLYLGRGADRVVDATGRDHVFAGPGPDVTGPVWYAELGAGNDRYLGDRKSCIEVRLGTGNDVSGGNTGWGGVGSCDVYGGEGRDHLIWGGSDAPGVSYETTLDGGPGPDALEGGYNHDTLRGGPGDDEISPDEDFGLDHVFGGDGNDVIHLDPWILGAGVTVFCGPGQDRVTGWNGERRLSGCEIK